MSSIAITVLPWFLSCPEDDGEGLWWKMLIGVAVGTAITCWGLYVGGKMS